MNSYQIINDNYLKKRIYYYNEYRIAYVFTGLD